ncbi:DUF2249 domain-containing protein [Halolamina salina]|uniref:DUF2249 domain-containing protein n=1 Tax=Halolamina salina TaxID=1220023 RepID=A0ABD6B7L6_9EURY
MSTQVDLRDRPEAEHREQLFDALEASESGDSLDIVADRDIDSHLVRYQIERGRSLDWEYADPDAEPRELRLTVGDALDDAAAGTIDVRDLKPQRRHEALLDTFDELGDGEGFVLVNDHDPKPLYHELRSMHGDIVDWEYTSRESGEWRVEVTKTGDSAPTEDDVVTRYDVREIPKEERHPTIHHRYGMIPEGGTMELVAPHEPRPLHREFRERYGESFSWEVVESKVGRCRVRITKEGTHEGDSSSTADDEVAESSDDEVAESSDDEVAESSDDEVAESSDDEVAESSDDEVAESSDDEAVKVAEELDVRDLPPAQRHEQIFEAYEELDVGEGFVLVNDHDPKPLYHQFEAEAGPEFHWSYRKRDPEEFRVLVGKAAVADDAVTEESGAPF